MCAGISLRRLSGLVCDLRLPLQLVSSLLLSNLLSVQILTVYTERPLHLSFFTLLFLGIFWFALRRWDPSPQSANAPTIHPLIPIDERVRPDPALLRLQKFVGSGRRVFTACKPSSVLLVTCTVIRALILRSIILDVQCSGNGIEVGIP